MEVPKQLLEKQTCDEILEVRAITGGDINDSYKINCRGNNYFMKCNKFPNGREMLETEEDSLKRLLETGMQVPKVLNCNTYEETHFILMEWVPPNKGVPKDMESAGRQLANTHRHSAEKFGLPTDNYIGPLKQNNNRCTSWPEFYIAQRIEPLIRQAVDKKMLDEGYFMKVKKLYKWMEENGNGYTASLIHGDLWSGNLMFDDKGAPWFIDPVVAYCDREMDLAMTRLFGGFPVAFYAAYQEEFPLADGHEARVALYQLYYLLVHLILFGGGYYSGVERSFEMYM